MLTAKQKPWLNQGAVHFSLLREHGERWVKHSEITQVLTLAQGTGMLKTNNHRAKDWSPLNADNPCEESLPMLYAQSDFI